MSGVLLMGMGDSVIVGNTRTLPAGSFVVVPASSHHYEGARGQTVLYLHGIGPLTTTYVDAQGRPRR